MNQRPLFAVFAGCWLGEAIFHIPWMVVIITLFLLCVFFEMKRRECHSKKGVFLLLVGVFLGIAFAGFYEMRIKGQEGWIARDSTHRIIGKIQWKEPTKTGYCLTLENNYDIKKKRYLEGKVLLYTRSTDDFVVGHRVSYEGELEPYGPLSNLGEFPLKKYYAAKEIYFHMFSDTIYPVETKKDVMGEGIQSLKRKLRQRIKAYYEDDVGQIVEAMSIGDKSEVTFQTKDLFQASGLIHVLAISGLHISMIGATLFRRLRSLGLGFWICFIVCSFGMLGYCQLTGNSVSALRAALMLWIYMLGQCLGKSYDLLTALAGSSIVLLLQCPARATDSSFIYSVTAVLVIGWVQATREDKKKGWRHSWKENLRFCVCLQVGMLPVSMYFQYEFYLFSFLSNLFLLPIISAGFLCSIFSLLIPLAPLIYMTKHLFLLVLQVTKWISSLEIQRIVTGSVPILYVVILYFMLYLAWKNHRHILWLVLFGCFVSLPCFVPRNRLAFVDVGQGDGIVLTNQNQSILIDGGSSTKKNVGRYVLLPYLKYSKVKKLDFAILTHTDSDHNSGMLELLEMGYIKTLVLGDIAKDDEYHNIISMAKRYKTKVIYNSMGDEFSAGDWKMKCIHPKKGSTLEKNAASQVYELHLWDMNFLLTGDVEKEGEEELLEQTLSTVDVLKVPHHGSKYTTSEEFLQKVQPRIGIISAGIDNRYGHPHKELLNRLEKYHVQILDTRTKGMIWMTKEKKGVEIHAKKG